MADRNGPELSWQTIVGALTAVALLGAAQWTIFQNQFSGVEKTQAADRAQIIELKNELAGYLSIREHNEYREGARAQVQELQRRATALESATSNILPKLAHDPVEQKTIDAINQSMAKQIDQIQAQIGDVNRQIAAALIIIDSNSSVKRPSPSSPP